MQDRSRRSNFGKRWLRRILAVLLGLLLFSEAGAVRAQGDRATNDGAVLEQSDASTEGGSLLQEGLRLYQQGTAESLQQSIEVWNQSRQWFRRAGIQREEAIALQNVGTAYSQLYRLSQNRRELKQALAYTKRALPLFSEDDWFNQANTLHNIGAIYSDLGDLEQALTHYEQALPLWQRAGLPIDEANTSYWIGFIHTQLKNWSEAVLYYSQALKLWQEEDTQLWHSETLRAWKAKTAYGLGQAYKNLDRTSEAIDALDQAAGFYQAEGNSNSTAYILVEIGNILSTQREWEKAVEYFNLALPLWQENYISEKADNYNKLGEIYRELSNYSEALKAFSQAFSLYRAVGKKSLMAAALNNIGLLYLDQQEVSTEIAQSYFEKALSLYEEEDYQNAKATTLGNLGLAYEIGGEKEKAVEAYQQALAIWENLKEVDRQAQSSINIGRIYYDLGNFALANHYGRYSENLLAKIENQRVKANVLANLGYITERIDTSRALACLRRALDIQSDLQDWSSVGRTLNIIISIKYDLDKISVQEYADNLLRQVLPLVERSDDRRGIAVAYQNLGVMYTDIEPLRALEFLAKARDIWAATQTLDGLAEAHYAIAGVYQRQDELDKALSEVNTAISIIEHLRAISGGDSVRTSYFSTVQNYYDRKIGLLIGLASQGDFATSFRYQAEIVNVIEQTRARSLSDLLANSKVDLRLEEVDPIVRAEEEELRHQLKEVETRLSLESFSDLENLRTLEQQYRDLSERLNRLSDRIKITNPAYANSIKYVVPWRLLGDEGDIHFPGLGDNFAFLQYHLGERQSYLFSLTGSTFEYDDGKTVGLFSLVHENLPNRTEIEAAAGKLLDGIRLGWRESEILQRGACLRQKILPKEVLQSAAGKKLVIAADGILQTVPFAALPLPNPDAPETDACNAETFNADGSQTYQPLIEKYEIVNIPSITSVQILRAQQQAPAPKKLAILADPIFTTDPRTKQQAQLVCENTSRGETNAVPPETLPIELQAALRSTRGTLNPLPCTRNEANAILEEINDAPQTLEALDYAATQAWVKTAPLSDYRIVHFATHGIIDDNNPGLSGLVLSQVDRQGKPIEDYYLRLNDIFNLKLNAELVVLSACETGLGEDVHGEGIIGLTRGFMYAGAKRVMTSFWRVEDGSTARLMEHFYRFMLKAKLSPAAALRQAQLEMRKEPTSRASQWAAFTIQGEWN